MKITNVGCYMHYSVWRNIIFVKVETDEGITGIGEASIRNKEMAVKAAIEEHLKPIVVGMSPFDIEKFFQMTFIKDAWRGGAVFLSAISGIEMAMWDIIGQKLGVPVYNMLGGKIRSEIPLYANTWFMDAHTIEEHAEAAKKVVALGFKAMKWDPFRIVPEGTPERKKIDMGIEMTKAVREAVGDDVELYIELHGSCTYDGALRYALLCERYGLRPGFLEEPMHPDNFAGYRKLAMKVNFPIAAGERYFTRFGHREINEEGFYSIVQPDLTHSGGILETKKMAAAAEAYGFLFAPHNSGGPVGTMASAMVDAGSPAFLVQEFSLENLDLSGKFFEEGGGLDYKDGKLTLSDNKPGLGLKPKWDVIGKEEYKHWQTY